jgi:hypothetical protein
MQSCVSLFVGEKTLIAFAFWLLVVGGIATGKIRRPRGDRCLDFDFCRSFRSMRSVAGGRSNTPE